MNAQSKWKSVASYAVGVWGALTAWAALAQYVLPGRGHALGKLGSFHWVLLINLFPALLCALGFAVGSVLALTSKREHGSGWRVALLAGLVFPLTVRLLRPLLAPLGAGMMPALVWCVIGSAGVAWLVGRWERRADGPRSGGD
ncbi:MAG: hypothetical protein WBM03_08940 [Steroidobacteraceae bacterium]